MNGYTALLVVAFLATAPPLVGGLVATSATVGTDIVVPPNLVSPCSLTSTGTSSATTSCGSRLNGIPLANADSSASAILGSLSLYDSVDTSGSGEGYGKATAQYDYLITFPGATTGTITGKYSLSGASTNDQGFTTADWTLSIGQGNSTFQSPSTQFLTETVTLSSSFTAGQALEITGYASGWTSGAPTFGDYNTDVSLQLLGFFDQAGNPVTYAEVPEPVLWPLLFMSLAAIGALRLVGRT